MGVRINTIMQTCFFAVSGVLPRDEAIGHIKKTIEKTYSRKGADVVQKNFAAVDHTLAHLFEVKLEGKKVTGTPRPPAVSEIAPDFVKRVTGADARRQGRPAPGLGLPGGRHLADGDVEVGEALHRPRDPGLGAALCIQCNKCALICPHAAIRPKFYAPELLAKAPAGFLSMDYKSADEKGKKYSLQVAPDDCTGCTLCVEMCPAESKTEKGKKAINMVDALPLKEKERKNWDFFLSIPDPDRTKVKLDVKGTPVPRAALRVLGRLLGLR